MLLDEIEAVLNKKIRPELAAHGGGLVLLGAEQGIVRVRLTGKCSGCPSATLTTESLIQKELCECFATIKSVILVSSVNEDLLMQAKDLLSKHSV